MSDGFAAPGRKSYRDSNNQWDELIVESPLNILINDKKLSNIRTPGDDLDLIRGFLLSEGFVPSLDNIDSLKLNLAQGSGRENDLDQVLVKLNTRIPTNKFQEGHEIRPSCGLCGDTQMGEEIAHRYDSSSTKSGDWDLTTILKAPEILREQQGLFAKTGSCHAAALFSKQGELLYFAEDVGRHNAVDKVIGQAARNKQLFENLFIFLSGRCGFELISKAARVGIPVVASVSGTTSMSLDLAKKAQITLISFCRNKKARVYNDPGRLIRTSL